MMMVPNLTLLLDLRKSKHPPLPVFEKVVQVPVKWSKGVIAVFIVMIFVSDSGVKRMLKKTLTVGYGS